MCISLQVVNNHIYGENNHKPRFNYKHEDIPLSYCTGMVSLHGCAIIARVWYHLLNIGLSEQMAHTDNVIIATHQY